MSWLFKLLEVHKETGVFVQLYENLTIVLRQKGEYEKALELSQKAFNAQCYQHFPTDSP